MKITSIDSNRFSINFTLLNKCNYSCRYCNEYLYSGSSPIIPAEDYISFFKNLFLDNPQIFDYQKRTITFTGGEPSLYQDIEILNNFFRENNFETTIISNGSAKLDFWERLNNINSLVLSFHPRYANFKHFESIIRIIQNKNIKITVLVLMDSQYWDRAIEALEHFKKNNSIVVIPKGILIKFKKGGNNDKQGQYEESYSEEQLNFLKNNHSYNSEDYDNEIIVNYDDGTSEKFDGQKIISNNLYKFTNYRCESGKSSLSIKHDGTVCGSACNFKDSVFGNIIENRNLRVKLLKNGVICFRRNCSCIYDLKIKKYKLI